MTHRIGRRNRWWARGFVLLGLAICFFLPFGAIGAIDASFTSSVVVPHQRTNTQHQARPTDAHSARGDDANLARPAALRRTAPLVVPVLRRLATPHDPLTIGALLILVALFTVVGVAHRSPANTPQLARPPSRGPPSYC